MTNDSDESNRNDGWRDDWGGAWGLRILVHDMGDYIARWENERQIGGEGAQEFDNLRGEMFNGKLCCWHAGF